jgi:hypothetical protein
VKSEMVLMNMDERQRLAWFMANRGTLIGVGSVWISMIAWDLTHGRMPIFLMAMVPVFALFRLGLYFFYCSKPFVGATADWESRVIAGVRVAAAVLLVVSVLVPIYSIPGNRGEEDQVRYIWDFVDGDAVGVVLVVLTYLWPVLIFGLGRLRLRGAWRILVQFAAPLMAVGSAIVILWIPQLIFETTVLFFFLITPVTPQPEWGCYLGVAANGLYMIGWLAAFLRPEVVQEG